MSQADRLFVVGISALSVSVVNNRRIRVETNKAGNGNAPGLYGGDAGETTLQFFEFLLVHPGLFEDGTKGPLGHVAGVHRNIRLPSVGIPSDSSTGSIKTAYFTTGT
ncbi:MAG: hypothetical protein M0Q93_01890 [Terrimicrobiaceae bacterium]|nr:hypothetical protein [Terrimicrobiaceae bacterium]